MYTQRFVNDQRRNESFHKNRYDIILSMDRQTFFLALLTLLCWGIGAFIAKLAANRIGGQSIFWDTVGYAITAVVFSLFIFKPSYLFSSDKLGVTLAIISGAIGSFGGLGFYLLMARKDASVVAPLTALYPALVAVLAFIFLRESLTLIKVFGIILATAAMVLLSL